MRFIVSTWKMENGKKRKAKLLKLKQKKCRNMNPTSHRLSSTVKNDVVTTDSTEQMRDEDSLALDCQVKLVEWNVLGLPSQIMKALADLNFLKPTEIQHQAIPLAMGSQCDIIGAAETGSGKTLAFGIPILNYIINHPVASYRKKKVPKIDLTNEIVKIKSDGTKVVDLNEVVISKGIMRDKEIENGEEESFSPKKRRKQLKEGAKSTGLVSFLDDIPEKVFQSMLKGDTRLEDLNEDEFSMDNPMATIPKEETKNSMVALILAPTRELALQVKSHLEAVAKYTKIQVCAVVGGMSSQKQERLLNLCPQIVVATPGRLWKMMKEEENPHLNSFSRLNFLVLDEADRMIEHGHFTELSLILERIANERPAGSYRTMVFSATLTLSRQKASGKKAWKVQTGQQSIENLITRTGLAENAAVIDLTSEKVTVERLTESKIMCTMEDKDLYLYYCLLVCKGRTIIFTNSLDCLNRIKSFLDVLKFNPLSLHARMQQRQRLKHLDRFTDDSNGLMVASDVAARGLDIPKVEHVIHYQVPKNSEVYVHRSGRTARGRAEGFTVMLVGPDDLQAYKNVCRTLNKEQELLNFPIDVSLLKPLRTRVRLARKLDTEEHKLRKSTRNQSWLEQTAKAMDIILDEELTEEKEEKERTQKEQKKVLIAMRAELDHLLSQRLIPRDVSLSYPSIQTLKHHETILEESIDRMKTQGRKRTLEKR